MQVLAQEWERKLSFQAQRAYLDIADVYWLAHDFMGALLEAEGHHTEEELARTLTTFKHDFLTIEPSLAMRWKTFFEELSASQYGGRAPSPEDIHILFVHCRSLIEDTLHVATEPVDEFTKRLQAVRVLLTNKEYLAAEAQYRVLANEYEQLPEEGKHAHYARFHAVYEAILAARNAQRA
jgi:hypothetical protein